MQRLLQLREAAAVGALRSADLARWVQKFVDAVLLEGTDPRAALGLSSGRGHRLASADWRQALRDEHLSRAGLLTGGATPLARAIVRFLGHRWPLWRDRAHPPPHSTELERELFAAARATGSDLPRSPRQLRRILRGHQTGDFMSARDG